ncbi:MAG: hypothetical protein HPY55_09400 [Firmicutes bacterium]|nr:hypothetical protein [Bacillota bacterium]
MHRELEVHAELAGIGRNDDVNVVNLRVVPVNLQDKVRQKLQYMRSRYVNWNGSETCWTYAPT